MGNTYVQFQNNVLDRMSEVPATDDQFGMACALYVKSFLSREVDHDLLMAKSYMDSYKSLRRRLLGYQTTLTPGTSLDPVVRTYLPVDNTRQGVQTLITQLILNSYQDAQGLGPFLQRAFQEAVIDIQTLIPCYRVTETTSYDTATTSNVGGLSRGQLPFSAQIYEAYYLYMVPALAELTPYLPGAEVSSNGRTYMVLQGGELSTGTLGSGLQTTDGSVEALGGVTFVFRYFEPYLRSYMKQLDWHERYELDKLKTGSKSRRYPAYIAIDPDSFSFYAWPQLDANHVYQLNWTAPTVFGFQNTDIVPFDSNVEAAVAEYIWAKYYMTVDQDANQAAKHGATYGVMRSKLYAECMAKRRVMYTT